MNELPQILAQAVDGLPAWATPAGTVGLTGGVLFWFMRYMIVRMDLLISAVDRLTRAQLILVLRLTPKGDPAGKEAQRLLRELGQPTPPEPSGDS